MNRESNELRMIAKELSEVKTASRILIDISRNGNSTVISIELPIKPFQNVLVESQIENLQIQASLIDLWHERAKIWLHNRGYVISNPNSGNYYSVNKMFCVVMTPTILSRREEQELTKFINHG
jgi:hypothetical protein